MIKMSVAAKPFTKEEGDEQEIFEQTLWPNQGNMVGQQIDVHYSQGPHEGILTGEVIRHDEEFPFLIVASFADGSFIMNRPLADMEPCCCCGGEE